MARSGSIAIVAVVAGGQLLAGCQAYLPRDETPVLPAGFTVPVADGASSQRLGPDGYPLLGAYPRAAAAQADPAVVAAEQARFANVGQRSTPAVPGAYQRTVAELGALAAERNRLAAQGRATSAASVDELRAIAARQQALSAR